MSVVLNGEFTVNFLVFLLSYSCRDLLFFLYFFHIRPRSCVNSILFSSLQVPSLHLEQGRAIQPSLKPAFPSTQTPQAALQPPAAEAPRPQPLRLLQQTSLQLKVSLSTAMPCEDARDGVGSLLSRLQKRKTVFRVPNVLKTWIHSHCFHSSHFFAVTSIFSHIRTRSCVNSGLFSPLQAPFSH